MKKEFKLLLVEDSASDAALIQSELQKGNLPFTVLRVETEEQFLEALDDFIPDAILCDQSLPQFDAFTAMKILKKQRLDIPFLLVTGSLSDAEALDYLRWGAYDYISKNNLGRLPFAVKNALSKCMLMQENRNMEFAHVLMRKNQQTISERHKGITDSMHYAKGIQKALLPKQTYIHRYFPESFLINLPKDIVSGDFYWVSECKDKFIVAVGDCTGHGVPAALISMMGYNKLDQIVNVTGITDPAHILARLNSEMREAFKAEANERTVNDGMDIAVCVIDKKNNRLEFAGANRPLYYIREGVLQSIKGDKKCIGGCEEASDPDYTLHTLPLSALSSVYLFTDGFTDQFGGKDGKKFLRKRFNSLLSSVHSCSMQAQKEVLLDALNDWKGMEEQTDDICVLGISF